MRMLYVLEVIMNVYGSDFGVKLRSVCGTQDRVQVQGVLSGVSYTQEKITLISLNKTILSGCNQLYRAVEKVLQKSSCIQPLKTHSAGTGDAFG